MKKTALIVIASASMLFAAPGMNTDNMQNQGMKQGKKYCKDKYKCNTKRQKIMNSPFLIKHGLPHFSRMIMPYLNDPDFNLTSEQKFQLAKLRKSSMSAIREVKPKVTALRKEIIKASQTGVSSEKLKAKVAELALLESTATLIQLKCIESTKAILTKDQLFFLLVEKKKNSKYGNQNKPKKCNKRY